MKSYQRFLVVGHRTKFRIRDILSLAGILLFLLPAGASGESPVPDAPLMKEGFNAEMAGQLEKAVELYRASAEKEGESSELWIRIGDIEWSLGRPLKAAEAFARASALSPKDHQLLLKLTRAYSVANKPALALESIEKAVALEPDNIEYLKDRGRIANWNGRHDIAVNSYKRILALLSGEDEAELALAKAQMWSGDLDAAVRSFRTYVNRHPEQKDVLMEYADAEGWRGNYPAALNIIERYRRLFGEDNDYRKKKARILAWARRPTLALGITEGLLRDAPQDYEVNYSRTIALYYANRPGEALESLKMLEGLRPSSQETGDIGRFVRTDLRSSVEGAVQFYRDSDKIRILSGSVKGRLFMSPETYLEATTLFQSLRADNGSGFENTDGSRSAEHSRVWIGGLHRFSPKLSLEGHVGGSAAESETRLTYDVVLGGTISDELQIKLLRDYNYYAVSPRTVSLGIRRGDNRLSVHWEPDLSSTIDVQASYASLSDNNHAWEVLLGPRRAFLRTAKFNLDIGLSALWFGFDKDRDNGYYDPQHYQRYALAAFGYWKVSDDSGVSIAGSLGMLKDDTMSSFRFGYDVNAEGTFGIHRDWMLKVRGGVSHNVRQTAGAFNAYTIGVALTRRF